MENLWHKDWHICYSMLFIQITIKPMGYLETCKINLYCKNMNRNLRNSPSKSVFFSLIVRINWTYLYFQTILFSWLGYKNFKKKFFWQTGFNPITTDYVIFWCCGSPRCKFCDYDIQSANFLYTRQVSTGHLQSFNQNVMRVYL